MLTRENGECTGLQFPHLFARAMRAASLYVGRQMASRAFRAAYVHFYDVGVYVSFMRCTSWEKPRFRTLRGFSRGTSDTPMVRSLARWNARDLHVFAESLHTDFAESSSQRVSRVISKNNLDEQLTRRVQSRYKSRSIGGFNRAAVVPRPKVP